MTTLTADRFPTVAVVDALAGRDGYFLGKHATQPANSCTACGVMRRDHTAAWHPYKEPANLTRKLRILARRRMREAIERNRTEYATVMAEYRAAGVL